MGTYLVGTLPVLNKAHCAIPVKRRPKFLEIGNCRSQLYPQLRHVCAQDQESLLPLIQPVFQTVVNWHAEQVTIMICQHIGKDEKPSLYREPDAQVMSCAYQLQEYNLHVHYVVTIYLCGENRLVYDHTLGSSFCPLSGEGGQQLPTDGIRSIFDS